MKVLQINSVCGVGSTGRIATDIHSILVQQGHQSVIAYGRGEAMNCENTIRIGNNLDNYVHVGLTRVFDRHGFGSIQATKNFIKAIEQVNPDVIHLHNIHGYYLNVEILFEYLKKANKPVVWTLHDCWSFTGHCSHFDYIGCDKWKTGCHNCPQKKAYPKSDILDQSKKNYLDKKEIFTGVENLTIVTPSQWLANLVKESYLKEYPVKVINNGIDLETFKPTESDFRTKHGIEDKFMILGVASVWNEMKGLKYFFKMADELQDDEVIVLVGLTKEQNEQLPDNMIGITRTNSVQELAEIYSTSNIFVNPTLEDTFPTTNLESLGCGTPVITFNTGGSIESINDKNGVITGPNTIQKLQESICKIKNKEITFDSENIAKDCRLYYDKTHKFNEYCELYKELFVEIKSELERLKAFQ